MKRKQFPVVWFLTFESADEILKFDLQLKAIKLYLSVAVCYAVQSFLKHLLVKLELKIFNPMASVPAKSGHEFLHVPVQAAPPLEWFFLVPYHFYLLLSSAKINFIYCTYKTYV